MDQQYQTDRLKEKSLLLGKDKYKYYEVFIA